MKRMWLASASVLALSIGAASAADLRPAPVYKAPPPVAPVPWTWTGFYIGGNFGGGWSHKDWTRCGSSVCGAEGAGPPGDDGSQNLGGVLGGGQVGFNFQFAPKWVAGVEADFDAANLTGGSGFTCFPANAFGFFRGVEFDADEHNVCNSKVDFIGTITARVGPTFGDFWLYALGGGAWVHDKYSDDYFNDSGQTPDHFTASETRWGWTVGLGAEYAIDAHWSARLQYNYMDFGTKTVNFTSPTLTEGTCCILSGGPFYSENIKQTVQMVTVGINYRFDFGRGLFGY